MPIISIINDNFKIFLPKYIISFKPFVSNSFYFLNIEITPYLYYNTKYSKKTAFYAALSRILSCILIFSNSLFLSFIKYIMNFLKVNYGKLNKI